MQTIIKKQKCSGCHACYNICPVNCITMEHDDEGFLYPVTDEAKCVNCGLCQKVCPALKQYKGNPKGQAYACINRDENIRFDSSSGGIFTLLAEEILNCGGVVFGAAFDEKLNVYHTQISEKSELYKLRGSKYVQSSIGDTYNQVKEHLINDKMVLFSGTPCQISGLKSFLMKEYENLILTDVICHGVPSPKVWKKYIEYREKETNSHTHKTFFRSKQNGWQMSSVRFEFSNGSEYEQIYPKDLFMQGFLANLYLRPSCYNCHSKSLERESDITLADFWGVEKVLPEMFDNKGTSLVFINSEKGKSLFEKILDEMIYKLCDIDEAVKYNPSAHKSCDLSPKRQKFMKKLDKMDLKKNIKKYTSKNIIHHCINKIKRIIKKLLKGVNSYV